MSTLDVTFGCCILIAGFYVWLVRIDKHTQTPPPAPPKDYYIACDFCLTSYPPKKKGQQAGHYITQGVRTKICDRCIDDCCKIVQEEKKK